MAVNVHVEKLIPDNQMWAKSETELWYTDDKGRDYALTVSGGHGVSTKKKCTHEHVFKGECLYCGEKGILI